MRRLPIAEQQLRTAAGAPLRDTNFILNVNDVVSALLAVHGGADWQSAIDAAVPMRKRLPAAGSGAAAGAAASSPTADEAAATVGAGGAANGSAVQSGAPAVAAAPANQTPQPDGCAKPS